MPTQFTLMDANLSHADAIYSLLPKLADFDVPARRNPMDLWTGDKALMTKVLAGDVENSFARVALDPEQRVAGLTLTTLRAELLSGDASAHLEAIVVADHARRQGLGQTLLHDAEQLAKLRGAQSMSLHVFANNQRARALYDGTGYDSELIRAIKWLN